MYWNALKRVKACSCHQSAFVSHDLGCRVRFVHLPPACGSGAMQGCTTGPLAMLLAIGSRFAGSLNHCPCRYHILCRGWRHQLRQWIWKCFSQGRGLEHQHNFFWPAQSRQWWRSLLSHISFCSVEDRMTYLLINIVGAPITQTLSEWCKVPVIVDDRGDHLKFLNLLFGYGRLSDTSISILPSNTVLPIRSICPCSHPRPSDFTSDFTNHLYTALRVCCLDVLGDPWPYIAGSPTLRFQQMRYEMPNMFIDWLRYFFNSI